MKTYFITGIGTDIGKTFISSILVESLKADYWKPIQSGDLDNSDSHKVKKLITNNISKIHPEFHRLSAPISPHAAAKLDKIKINISNINIPITENHLIIEGAGGIFVPLNDKEIFLDLIIKINCEVIIVSKNYLGSINHTLLTINALKEKKIKIKGLFFSGKKNLESETIIKKMGKIKILGKIPHIEEVNSKKITEIAKKINL